MNRHKDGLQFRKLLIWGAYRAVSSVDLRSGRPRLAGGAIHNGAWDRCAQRFVSGYAH